MSDEKISEQYVESVYAEDVVLEKVKAGIRNRNMPEISIAPGYGRLLTLLVLASGAREVLEIGALGGYSGICLARGLAPGGRLTSLEVDAGFAGFARSNLEEAGFGDRVDYRVGPALDSLAELEREGRRFDFFFIDADKGNYPRYLDWAIRLGNPGALIVGDNILLHGRIADPEISSPSVRAIREFNERIASDPRLDSTLLPAYDGLAVARLKA
jgi:predicted O-methyltransferase YrrM